MLASGMKPIFVFDGKPPTMKRAELAARAGKRGDADAGLAAAKEAGDAEAIEKFSKRTVKVAEGGGGRRAGVEGDASCPALDPPPPPSLARSRPCTTRSASACCACWGCRSWTRRPRPRRSARKSSKRGWRES